MAVEVYIKTGQTKPVEFTLRYAGGDYVNLTGATVEARLKGEATGTATIVYRSNDASPKVGISDAAKGRVWVNLSALRQEDSPYLLFFWVEESPTSKHSFPSQSYIRVVVESAL